MPSRPPWPRTAARSAPGRITAPDSRCDPACLPFSTTREGHVAEPLGDVGVLLEQLPEADRAREAGGPGADDEHADLDALVDRVGRLGDEPRRRRTRGAKSAGRDISRACLREQLDELGHDRVHVADDREVAELEDRRVRVLVDRRRSSSSSACPTLCCTAPEIPSAT